MKMNRRKALGLAVMAGAGSRVMLAQSESVPGPAPARTADDELQIARQERLSDAQRIAMVKLPQSTEPAFHFRP